MTAGTATNRAAREWVPGRGLLPTLVALVAAVSLLAAAIGAYDISPAEVLGSVMHRLGLNIGPIPAGLGDDILWEIRFPRGALALLVGASLGAAGATMQGSFSNPLAEPGVIGVSAGAAVGAVAQIALGFSIAGTWSTVVAAFIGGFITVLFVYLAARSNGRTEVVTLVLVGIAVNALAGAIIGLLTFYSNDAELRSITFWTLGSMAQATWSKVAVIAPITLLGVGLALLSARKLDLLSLGERPARHLGVDVEALRIRSLIAVALLTASAVAVAGIISFVGLVIPHIMRMIGGPSHRLLLPASALAGAAILVGADLAARTIAQPSEVPLGVLTALIGAPFFLWQLRRTRAQQGGWA
ncbi:MAG TPA: iron ABC transporter permease [Tepidiformaceae bacterium]|nr:iron ABC transporter permease [Tepidiformaceae bacterium]